MRSRLTIPLSPGVGALVCVLGLILTIRDMRDGVARYVVGFPDYKRDEYPVNFWFISILRLIIFSAGLGVSIYCLFFAKGKAP